MVAKSPSSENYQQLRNDVRELVERLLAVDQEMRRPGTVKLPTYFAVSDLHGNIHRLREILDTAEVEGIEKLFLVGDMYSGRNGWEVYQALKPLISEDPDTASRVVPLFGNHELALVAGMLGNDRQMKFFYAFGGR